MKLLKKSFRILAAAILVMAFALTVTACKKNDTRTWKVTFNSNKGSLVATQYPEDGTKATRPDDPTREGFVFVDWYDDTTYENVYDFDTPVTKDITLYAKWTAGASVNPNPPVIGKKVTITLNYNYDGKTESVEISKGATLPVANQTPERTDWNFAGWYKDSACTQLFNLTESINADLPLYAKWTKDPVQPADGTGIDFSKEWDGTSTGGSGSDNFVFDKTVSIGSITTEPTLPETPADEGQHVLVTFNANGGSSVSAQSVLVNGTAALPVTPEKDGYMFCGWYTDNNTFNTAYDFNAKVNANLTLHAKWAQVDSKIKSVNGYNESLAVVFSESNPASARVQYALKGTNAWKNVDAPLIRKDDNGTARVDILGLAAGEYNVKITPSSGGEITLPEAIAVTSYDRSGYAHFNRKTNEAAYNGVGAYKDDGTLKDNALVIYVTDANKDTVMDEVCAANPDVPMFKIPGSDWGNKNASGIGWWLNNNQYTASNEGSKKNKVPSNTYDKANGGKLSFKAVDRPLVIRFIGTVTTPEGLTAFNSTKEGGGIGDNGHMARLKNLKNVTLEGVGTDATIDGWGFHYVIGTDAVNGQGTSFEVRNLTFTEYPEDAIGMEGQQSGSTITAGVERCWVHNNVFLPGRCDSPAESDKKEGDGSCDFKRGQYFTLSYNYFEYCHKTNLIGSSDSSLQYNITMHHNMWYQCGSRIPLLRQANVHFYNNYILGDATETTTPYPHIAKPSLSYVTSLRANCLMFSEANYYDGCKNYAQNKGSATGVGWDNIYNNCSGDDSLTDLSSRTQSVSSSCAYNGVRYTGFYTNESLFYYDKSNQASDCLLDDAVGARSRVLQSVGVNGFGKTDISMNKYVPDSAVSNGAVDLTKVGKGSSKVNNVLFNGITGVSSGTIKGKGQIITFTLTAPVEVKVTTSATTDADDLNPYIYDSFGKVYASKFTGTVTIVLDKGTYVIASGQKDKEATITALSFADTGASSEARVNEAKAALAAIPDEIGTNSYNLIKAAKDAYNALLAAERGQIDSALVARMQKAEAAYAGLAVERVIARIDYIGAVDETSYNKINAARKEYVALTAEKQAQVTNLAKLVAAEKEFAQFAAKNVNDRIADLPDLSKATISTQETLERVENWFKAVAAAYDELDETQREQIKNYSKVVNGFEKLQQFENLIVFRTTLEDTEVATLTLRRGAALKILYAKLTEEQQGMLTLAETKKYEEIAARHTELASQAVTCTFIDGKPSAGAFVSTGAKQNAKKTEFTVHAYSETDALASGLKFESSTEITVTVETKMTLTLYLFNDQAMKIGDNNYNVETTASGDRVVTVVLEKGTYKITRAKSENSLYYATLTPAS